LKLQFTNSVPALAAPDTGALEDQTTPGTKVAALAKTGSSKLFGAH
jgi:hypothetical protein